MAVLVMTLLCSFLVNTASAGTKVPDDQKAILTVKGQGVSPHAEISLSTGPKQTITSKADSKGNFLFSNLKFSSFSDLKFSIDIPPYNKGLARSYPANRLEFKYDSRESYATMKGNIGKSSTLAFSMAGSNENTFKVAGETGYVELAARSQISMASGKSSITASIVNAAEACCPRLMIPADPILLTISSRPIDVVPPKPNVVVPVQKNVPFLPDTKTNPVPFTDPSVEPPQIDGTPEKKEEAPKKKVPFIIQGEISTEKILISEDTLSAGISFSSAEYDATHVGGLRRLADDARNAVLLNITALGAFIDSRNLLDSLRAIQISTAQTLINYAPSDSVCTFGTLNKSTNGSDSIARANQLAFSKIIMDRHLQKKETIFSNVSTSTNTAIQNFKAKYCNPETNGTFLRGYCQSVSATPDTLYDRDVDFTRVFDVPLTLNADFTTSERTDDKDAVLALFDNLAKIPPMSSSDGNAFNPRDNSAATQDFRSLEAMRSVTANSFAALVSEKAKSTSTSTQYMHNIMRRLGLDTAGATRYLGANPSYFAQMEVLTKKLYQDPSFYANLYEGEANVDRQRVAMKAIELQQERDFLESLRRREMLLSVLVNARIQTASNRADQGGYIKQ